MIRFARKALAVLTAIILLQLTAAAQGAANTYTLKLQLADASSGAAVEFATVSVSRPKAETPLKYTQTDDRGCATIGGIPAGTYEVRGILLGYEDFLAIVEIKDNTDLGVCKMKVQVNFIESATISDVGNPIVVKKDTIEHNVALLKSSDTDVLEDLLKRLPGVEVGTDGSITANGKTVSKVYIDGKTFFLDDPQLATKNLPAKIVNKVRVVEKKSEQAEFTGIDDGNEETVLDLSIKPGMMNGWMGNLTGGAGRDLRSGTDLDGNPIKNDWRFQGGGMLARFTEGDQIVALLNANNTNNRGFTDITGNAMGGMRGGGMRGGNNGISTSYMGGLNGTKTFDNKSELSGNYLFNANLRDVIEKSYTAYKNTPLAIQEDSRNLTNTYGHRFGGRADWKVSKNTSILFMPYFNYGWGDFSESTVSRTDNSSTGAKVNSGEALSTGDNLNKTAGGRLLWRQRIGSTPGRTVSVMFNYNLTSTTLDGLNQSTTRYYDDSFSTDSTVVDQQYHRLSNSTELGARVSYTEPLGRNFYAEAMYQYNYGNSRSERNTYDRDAAGEYTILDEVYSNTMETTNYRQRAGLSIKKQEEKYNITVGAQYHPTRTVNFTHAGGKDYTYDHTVHNWAPNARLDLNFSDYKTLRINYRGNTTQPSMTQLQPVPDNSNPQRVTLGNPDLTPSFSHNLRTEYNYTNMNTFASLAVFGNFSYSTNNIVNASWNDSKGIRYTVPMNNSDGALGGNIFMMFNSPIAKSDFSISSFTRINASRQTNYTGLADIDPDDSDSYLNPANYTPDRTTSLSGGENLRLVYRNDILEASLGGGAFINRSWYSSGLQQDSTRWNNNIEARFIAKIPGVLDISTNLRYNFYKGYAAGYADPMTVWNLEIGRQILHNSATISIKAYDILNQSKSVSHSSVSNYERDTYNNTLGRYVVLTFTWRFGKFGEGGNIMQRMMPPGGPGRGRGFGGPGRR